MLCRAIEKMLYVGKKRTSNIFWCGSKLKAMSVRRLYGVVSAAIPVIERIEGTRTYDTLGRYRAERRRPKFLPDRLFRYDQSISSDKGKFWRRAA
jgi:hypothetical protein